MMRIVDAVRYDEGDDDLHRHHHDYIAVSEPVLTEKRILRPGVTTKRRRTRIPGKKVK